MCSRPDPRRSGCCGGPAARNRRGCCARGRAGEGGRRRRAAAAPRRNRRGACAGARLLRGRGVTEHAGFAGRAVERAARRGCRSSRVLGLTQILAWGSSYYLPAVLAGPIARDTGWSLPWVVGGAFARPAGRGRCLAAGRAGDRPAWRAPGARGERACCCGRASPWLGLAPSLPVYLVAWVLIGARHGRRPLRRRLRHARPLLRRQRAQRDRAR